MTFLLKYFTYYRSRTLKKKNAAYHYHSQLTIQPEAIKIIKVKLIGVLYWPKKVSLIERGYKQTIENRDK